MTQILTRQDGHLVALNSAGEILMIDHPSEIDPYFPFIERATGSVLLLGLGLGIMAELLLATGHISQIHAVEIDPTLCDYVRARLPDRRLHIYNDDAWRWRPHMAFHFGFYSIWHLRNLETWNEKELLKSRYAPHVFEQWVDQEEMLDSWRRYETERAEL